MRIGWLLTVALTLVLAMPSAASAVTFTVDNTTNVNDSDCNDGDCSWPEAVTDANNTPNGPVFVPDEIDFSIGSGAQEIVLSGGHALTEAANVNGDSQPGYTNQPLIELDGNGTNAIGLQVLGGNSTIRGIAIHGFSSQQQLRLDTSGGNAVVGSWIGLDNAGASGTNDDGSTGILITGTSASNAIGTTSVLDRNVISGVNVGVSSTTNSNSYINNYIGTNPAGTAAIPNASVGMGIGATDTIGQAGSNGGNVISGNSGGGIQIVSGSSGVRNNRIGTNALGTAAIPNVGQGIAISGGGPHLVGGSVSGEGNLISGNTTQGIFVDDASPVTGLQIRGNAIGTNGAQTAAIPNGAAGVEVEGNDLTVGGTGSNEGNIIAGNGGDGVRTAGGAEDVSIIGNRIGTAVLGAPGNAARGVSISAGTDIIVGGTDPGEVNTITGNGLGGISTNSPTSFDIGPNSIFANSGLGIDLAANSSPQFNDGQGEADGFQNYPVLTSAINTGGSTNVTGSLVSSAGTSFRIDLYSSTSCDPTGFGEGQTLLDSDSRSTNGAGLTATNFTLPAVPVGRFITAVATREGGGPRSSEFSQCRQVTAASTPPAQTANLEVALSSAPNPAVPGDPLTYRATTTNRGPAAANNARVTISLPSTVEFRSASGGCSPSGAAVTCPLGNLANGQSASRDVVVIPRREGSLSATAQASSDSGDPSPAATSATTAAALPTPQTRSTFNASVRRGTVTVKCPGDRRFNQVEGDVDLSFRCLVDTRKGQLQITTTAGGGKLQSALFYEGIFKAGQTRGRRPATELRLAGRLYAGSFARGSKKITAEQARRRRRRLWGRGRGRFRTRGRRGSASVRGTTWLVEDRNNNTTFFKVTDGRVTVRDFVRRRSVNLGGRGRKKTYTARPRRR